MSEVESQPSGPSGSGPSDDGPDPKERQWCMIAHLSALAAFVIPFGNMLGPLIVWQMKKEEMPLAGAEALEALNFHITVSIAFVGAIILSFVLIGFLLMPIIGIGALAFTIIGAIQANQGTPYKYPFSWRVVS